ncbi:MAG: D-alanine--D-alanine ligase A, partial [Anaerolineales bacterium]|nr:D-alanine--D-alanine ligase A [Anaerolineales bacterium]
MGKNIGNSPKKLHVGLIFGGRSGEHEVSLASARSVLANLDPEKYEVTQIGITHEGVWLVGDDALGVLSEGSSVIPHDNSLTPVTLLPEPTRHGIYIIHTQGKKREIIEHLTDLDVVFPVLHGTFGEDGTLQGLFELGDIAYVGAGVLGSAVGMDKDVFKKVMLAQQIPTVEWMVFERKQIENDMDSILEQAANLAPFPLFVKPCNLGSSVGITKCRSRADLIEGLLEA